VKMYLSNRMSEEDWDLQLEEGGVTVFVARPQLLLAMKLKAGRGARDAEDIDRLLDACVIVSLESAQEIFDHLLPRRGHEREGPAPARGPVRRGGWLGAC